MKFKSKPSIIVFSVIGILFLATLITTIIYKATHGKTAFAKVVIPVSQDDQMRTQGEGATDSDGTVFTSFIPLQSTETLVGTLTLDFDYDGLDDQVVAVRKAGVPYLVLIAGLYNQDTNTYDRSAEITTEISKIRTFSFNAIDMIGNHHVSLVYQGVKANGDSVLQIYNCRRRRGIVDIKKIGDFSSDGTIFIQQSDRSDAYELSQAWGAPHRVWVYSSDRTDDSKDSSTSISQIQTEYSWDYDLELYTQNRQLRITGTKMAAKELSRIQNGNVETFAKFLNGLWYKTVSNGSSPRYIYFNYDEKEVIFLSDDTEGVYSWEESSLRRSGIYLTTVNTIISSMKRRFDIMLTGVNEVSVHVHDNVGMVIKESNQWDGAYRKMSFQNTFGEEKKNTIHEDFEKSLTESDLWFDDEENRYVLKENGYKVSGNFDESGAYVMATVGEYPVLQLRSASGESSLHKAYALQYEINEVIIPAKRRNQKPTIKKVINKDVINMIPVQISPYTCYESEGRIITLRRRVESAKATN